MTREEEIRQAALAYSFDTDGGYTGDLNTGRDDFTEGAEWADKHPINPWHSVADGDLPNRDGKFLTLSKNNYPCVYKYDSSENYWSTFGYQSDICYWMEIPQNSIKNENN